MQADKTALLVVNGRSGPERWSYAELDQAVRRVAIGIKALRLPSGSRIVLALGNSSDFALAFFACLAAGQVAVPTSEQLTPAELAHIVVDAQAAAVIAGDDVVLPAATLRISPAEFSAFQQLPVLPDYVELDPDTPAYLLYTSGTSGKPKGVLHAHRVIEGRRPMHADWLGLSAEDLVLHAGAFNWSYTLGVGLMDPWVCGATALLYTGKRDAGIWAALIAEHAATLFAAVPGVFRQLLASGALQQHDISSLRHGITAGEPLSPALLAAWRDATGRELFEALGMTEISTYISSGPATPTRPGSPGRPQTGRTIAILPQAGGNEPLPVGQIGLLAVHADDPGLMLGYWRQPAADAQTRRGNWFVGGDLARLDADGYLWFAGRADDVMNAGGYRVSPLEVEAVLAAHPDISEVAVAAVEVKTGVQLLAAFVVGEEPAGLLEFAGQRLAAYKCPRLIVPLRCLPRGRNGKLLRRQLQGLYRMHAAAEALNRRLQETVPVIDALGFRISHYDGQRLEMTLPLEKNYNDKGTAFAGSIASVAALSGWALLMLVVEERFGPADIAIFKAELDYQKPISADFHGEAWLPDATEVAALMTSLEEKGRGKIALQAQVIGDDGPAATLNGRYAVRLVTPA